MYDEPNRSSGDDRKEDEGEIYERHEKRYHLQDVFLWFIVIMGITLGILLLVNQHFIIGVDRLSDKTCGTIAVILISFFSVLGVWLSDRIAARHRRQPRPVPARLFESVQPQVSEPESEPDEPEPQARPQWKPKNRKKKKKSRRR